MSEHRKPELIIKIAKNKGNKTYKFYPASMWRYTADSSMRTWPNVQRGSQLKGRYRLSIDGKWYSKQGYQFLFLTEAEIWIIIRSDAADR